MPQPRRINKKEGFCILIPTINQKHLLTHALNWYLANMPGTEIFVLDNGKQGLVSANPKLKIFEMPNPMGVAASWNWLIYMGIQHGYEKFLVLNDDVILKRYTDEIDSLINAHQPYTFHAPTPQFNWSTYIITKQIFEKTGCFDENFKKCFFEDNDYEYRMRLAGITINQTNLLSPHFFLNSQSSIADPTLADFAGNREYYEQKWGGSPGEEKYTTPFNK